MPYISNGFRALFLLSLPRFCVALGKISSIFLLFCFFLHYCLNALSQRMYVSGTTYLVAQQNRYKNEALKKMLKNEEHEVNYSINQMTYELLSPQQHRKRFLACLSKTNMIERSFTANQGIKKTMTQPHEFCSYKISGTRSAIDQLFGIIKSAQSAGLFCKTMVLTKEGEDQYSVNLVFKEYIDQKK